MEGNYDKGMAKGRKRLGKKKAQKCGVTSLEMLQSKRGMARWGGLNGRSNNFPMFHQTLFLWQVGEFRQLQLPNYCRRDNPTVQTHLPPSQVPAFSPLFSHVQSSRNLSLPQCQCKNRPKHDSKSSCSPNEILGRKRNEDKSVAEWWLSAQILRPSSRQDDPHKSQSQQRRNQADPHQTLRRRH